MTVSYTHLEARFTTCGICTLMRELGLEKLIPAMCRLDYTMSEAGGVTDFVREYTPVSYTHLARTTTIRTGRDFFISGTTIATNIPYMARLKACLLYTSTARQHLPCCYQVI